jgi:hypothetical protein
MMSRNMDYKYKGREREWSRERYQIKKETIRASSKRWYHSHKDQIRIKSKQKYLSIKKEMLRRRHLLQQIKIDRGCQRCGFKSIEPYLFDFHHLTKDKKIGLGSTALTGYSIKHIMEEIDKCIVVCALCHRRIHHRLRLGLIDE